MRPPFALAVAMLAAAPGAGAGAGAGGGGGGAMHFIAMGALDVPIVEADRAGGRLRVKLVLRAVDEAGASRLRTDLPLLRETSLAAVSEFARLYATPFAPVDARRLAGDLQAALHARDPGIEKVLLVEVAAVRT